MCSFHVAPALLIQTLRTVVEDCVHEVGVDLNSAPPPLLARVAGMGPTLAGAIVAMRGEQGPFRSRQQLNEVPRLAPEAFTHAAGFLRVRGGGQALDATGVHPEHYAAREEAAGRLGKEPGDLLGAGSAVLREDKELEGRLGRWTREEVLRELERAGRSGRIRSGELRVLKEEKTRQCPTRPICLCAPCHSPDQSADKEAEPCAFFM